MREGRKYHRVKYLSFSYELKIPQTALNYLNAIKHPNSIFGCGMWVH